MYWYNYGRIKRMLKINVLLLSPGGGGGGCLSLGETTFTYWQTLTLWYDPLELYYVIVILMSNCGILYCDDHLIYIVYVRVCPFPVFVGACVCEWNGITCASVATKYIKNTAKITLFIYLSTDLLNYRFIYLFFEGVGWYQWIWHKIAHGLAQPWGLEGLPFRRNDKRYDNLFLVSVTNCERHEYGRKSCKTHSNEPLGLTLCDFERSESGSLGC